VDALKPSDIRALRSSILLSVVLLSISIVDMMLA